MKINEWIPTLSHATERDVDLLLVEELHASLEFTTWMSRHVNVGDPIVSWDVKHSKRRTKSRREIDIFVEINHLDGSRSALLIENKLDATEQPDQAESYREELSALASGYTRAAMIIVCPQAYHALYPNFVGKFDAVIEYEEIVGFLRELHEEASSEMVLRYGFRAEILEQAIHKHRRGYTPIPDKVVGDFNVRYVALLAELAPEIFPGPSMLKPANPRESTSMIFDQAKSLVGMRETILPRRFAHELGRGQERRANYVAVTFAGWGAALPSIRERIEKDAKGINAFFEAKRSTKVRPNPGLVMGLSTEPVDNQGDFDAQRDVLVRGIAKVTFLRSWLLSNQNLLAEWRALADAHRSTS